MTLSLLDENRRETERNRIKIQFNLAEVEGVETQFERAAGPARIDLVAIALQGERRIALDLAFLTPMESLTSFRLVNTFTNEMLLAMVAAFQES